MNSKELLLTAIIKLSENECKRVLEFIGYKEEKNINYCIGCGCKLPDGYLGSCYGCDP